MNKQFDPKQMDRNMGYNYKLNNLYYILHWCLVLSAFQEVSLRVSSVSLRLVNQQFQLDPNLEYS